MKYVIRSLHRHDDNLPSLFSAINGVSTMIFVRDSADARVFSTRQAAREYALKELFMHEAGVFDVLEFTA